MSLTVEDGSVVSGADSYLSQADCDAYNLAHNADATWIAASSDEKDQALRLATQYLDNKYRNRWKGVRVQQTQSLAWPRAAVIDYDGYEFDSDDLPTVLEDACAECAILFASSTDMLPDIAPASSGISSESKTAGQVGKSVTYAGSKATNTQYQMIDALMSDLVMAANTVVRG